MITLKGGRTWNSYIINRSNKIITRAEISKQEEENYGNMRITRSMSERYKRKRKSNDAGNPQLKKKAKTIKDYIKQVIDNDEIKRFSQTKTLGRYKEKEYEKTKSFIRDSMKYVEIYHGITLLVKARTGSFILLLDLDI